ncbi:MAG: hypothetical protein PHH85_13045 [Candidatus Methanoperedens sp.]|nr:hypothetical protein [Candidatus Methanoperedens sp.]
MPLGRYLFGIEVYLKDNSKEKKDMQTFQDIDENKIIAIDSKSINRNWENSDGTKKLFHGLMGVSLSVFQLKNFKETYEAILTELFNKYRLPKEEHVYKSAQIFSIFAGRPYIADNFINDFATKMLQIKELRFNIFFTTLETKPLIQEKLKREGKIPSPEDFLDLQSRRIVPIYGIDSGVETVTVPEFLNRIENYYPIICAWKLTEITKIKGQNFLVDFFEGEESQAWNELVTYNTVNTVAKGDNCNAYISAADMILRAIDRRLIRSKKLLVENDLREVVSNLTSEDYPDNVNVIRIWNPDLHYIKPIKPIQIQNKFFVKHPIIFIFNENDTKGERKELENSPMMVELYNRAYELNGGIIFYESGFSTSLMRDGDWFVSYGTKGSDTYKRLKKMGYNLNHHIVASE